MAESGDVSEPRPERTRGRSHPVTAYVVLVLCLVLGAVATMYVSRTVRQRDRLHEIHHRCHVGDIPRQRSPTCSNRHHRAAAAHTDELRKAFETHLQETRGHVERLERVFSDIGMPMPTEQCKAMRGLIAEGEEIVKASGDPAAEDPALIAAAHRVEHYEIAGC